MNPPRKARKPRKPRETERIAKEQHRMMQAGAWALCVVGVVAFVVSTALLLLDDEISVYAMLCLEIGGVASLLLGLKKLRDLRQS